VDIVADGKLLNWPILLSDIDRQSQARRSTASSPSARASTPGPAQAANFEEWCLELMGPILYERFIQPYTEKQWGRPARELSASGRPAGLGALGQRPVPLSRPRSRAGPRPPAATPDLIDGCWTRT
jgi:protoporphyrinogen oxidase